MKNVSRLIAIAVLVVGMVACSKKDEPVPASEPPVATTPAPEATSTEATSTETTVTTETTATESATPPPEGTTATQ